MMANCALLKASQLSQKKKTMCPTWDERQGSESEEDSGKKELMVHFMAIEEEFNESDENRGR